MRAYETFGRLLSHPRAFARVAESSASLNMLKGLYISPLLSDILLELDLVGPAFLLPLPFV